MISVEPFLKKYLRNTELKKLFTLQELPMNHLLCLFIFLFSATSLHASEFDLPDEPNFEETELDFSKAIFVPYR